MSRSWHVGWPLRVLETGSGEPVLFVPGTGGTGPYWGPLVRELPSFRCVMLDRPGWGLSSAIDYAGREFPTLVADVLRGTLDALGIDRAHVVGASIGGVWALRLAQRYPDRVGRIALLAAGPLLPEVPVTPFIKLLSSPLGAIIVRLPQSERMVRTNLRQLGHGVSLDAGRMDEFVAWRIAFGRETDSMRNERDLERAWRDGSRTLPPGLVESLLVRDSGDDMLFRIITVWSSREALEKMRASVDKPKGVQFFEAAGATPQLSMFDVVAHEKAG